MSGQNGGTAPAPKPKRKRLRLVPLLLLASDGHAYVCCPAKNVPPALLKAPGVIVAIRLNSRERDIALDALQNEGVIEVAKTLNATIGRRFDA